MKIIKYFFESFFVYLFFLLIKIIGLKFSRKLFGIIFNLIGPIIRPNQKINNNINIVFDNIDHLKRKRIISEMWKNYAKIFVEYMFLKKFRRDNNHISITGLNYLEKIKNSPKPVIFVSGHFSNFELMSMELTKAGISLATIYRPLNNIFLNPFMEKIRKKYICKHQIKKGLPGIRQSINFLKNNFSIALMVDQRLGEGKKISFFKKEALTTTLPAQLSLKFEIDIVPVYISRSKNDNYEMQIFESISVSDYANSEEGIIKLSKKINSVVENFITTNPSQWIWTHDRWK